MTAVFVWFSKNTNLLRPYPSILKSLFFWFYRIRNWCKTLVITTPEIKNKLVAISKHLICNFYSNPSPARLDIEPTGKLKSLPLKERLSGDECPGSSELISVSSKYQDEPITSHFSRKLHRVGENSVWLKHKSIQRTS